MFPEYGNNNGLFGGNGWGGGLIGFILGILLANGGLFGGNGFGYGGGLWGGAAGIANQLNNDNNADLVLNAIQGTDSDIRLLATTLNSDVNDVKAAINSVQSAIQQVGAQNGMGFLQVTNAIQSGDSAIARQLCECCCENRLLTTQQGYESRIQTIEQTNQLGSQADRNTQAITSAIAAQTTAMTKEFCDIKERELQNKIDTLTAQNTTLRNQYDNANQTAQIAAMIAPLKSEIEAVRAAQPATTTIQYPQVVGYPSWLVNGVGFFNNGWGSNSFWN